MVLTGMIKGPLYVFRREMHARNQYLNP